jgi:hypothetical protein
VRAGSFAAICASEGGRWRTFGLLSCIGVPTRHAVTFGLDAFVVLSLFAGCLSCERETQRLDWIHASIGTVRYTGHAFMSFRRLHPVCACRLAVDTIAPFAPKNDGDDHGAR